AFLAIKPRSAALSPFITASATSLRPAAEIQPAVHMKRSVRVTTLEKERMKTFLQNMTGNSIPLAPASSLPGCQFRYNQRPLVLVTSDQCSIPNSQCSSEEALEPGLLLG